MAASSFAPQRAADPERAIGARLEDSKYCFPKSS